VRVAVPLAAAAAIAVLFVGPSLMNPKQVREIAGNLPVAMPSQAETILVDAGTAPTTVHSDECDYNGDGVVDGRDIQGLLNFVNLHKDSVGDPQLEVERLQRCLLRS